MKSFFCKVLVICLTLFATYAFAEKTDRPDVHVGDRWLWQHTNGLVNEKDFTHIEDIVDVSDSEIRTRVRTKGKPESVIFTYTREWNTLDDGYAKWTPFLKELAFPLEIGKKWDGSADKRLFFKGTHGKFLLKGEVVAFEKVTVPAGTFDAYKINVVLDAISTNEDAVSGNTILTFWYAPSVKRYVKLEHTYSRDGRVRQKDLYELLEFSLR